MLYCILLHSALPDSLSAGPVGPQEPYTPAVIQVALQGLRFLNTFALLDLSVFQVFISGVAPVCYRCVNWLKNLINISYKSSE